MTDQLAKNSRRRFLFSVSGGYGHFHPLVPLARALHEVGHDVAFATGPSLVPVVEAAGFTALLMGGSTSTDPEYQQLKAEISAMPVGLETELFVYPRLFCGVGSRVSAPHLVEIAQQWKPDMVIREAGQYGAVIASEYLGLPYATVAFAAALQTMTVFEREAPRFIDPARRSWGLPPDPERTALYRYLHLCYSPPMFATQDVGGPSIPASIDTTPSPLPATTHFVRPDFFDNARRESLPAWMEDLPDQATVYVTLGTEANSEPDLYPGVLQTIIAGLSDLPINLIVTLGRDKDPGDFGPQPANVHIERYIPQSLLLPQCDVIVMHAGSNSLLQTIDAGIPMVLVPLIADQFFNAAVAERLRLGEVVSRDQLTPDTIRAAVAAVLRSPDYRENVGRLKSEMRSMPRIEYAVSLIEQVASTHEPVLNPHFQTRK